MLEAIRKVARRSRVPASFIILAAALSAASGATALDRTFGGTNGTKFSYDYSNGTSTTANVVDLAGGPSISQWIGWKEVTFSPDGQKVAFYSSGLRRIYVANADATLSNAKAVTDPMVAGRTIRNLRWAPNGAKLAYQRVLETGGGEECWALNSVTGVLPLPAPVQLSLTGELCSAPDWASDSAWLTYSAQTTSPLTDSEIYIQRSDGAMRSAITTNNIIDINPRWAPNGSGIAYSSGNTYNTLQVKLMGTAFTAGVWWPVGPLTLGTSAGNIAVWAWSPDSTKILTSNAARIVVLRAPTIIDPWKEYPTNFYLALGGALFSPDSTKIMYIAQGTSKIYTMNHDGTNNTLTPSSDATSLVSWKRN